MGQKLELSILRKMGCTARQWEGKVLPLIPTPATDTAWAPPGISRVPALRAHTPWGGWGLP